MMNETEAPLPATLTVVETAAFLGLAVQSTYKGIASGQIPHVKVGKRILVPRCALEAMLESARK